MRPLAITALLALATLIAGCADYRLQGRVIAGDASYIAIVDADDPSLTQGRGLPGATVTITTDPERLSREQAGSGVTRPDGSFAVEFTEPGGGFLLYDVGVRVTRPGYAPAELFLELPKSSRRLLVVLAPGREPPGAREEDPLEQYRRFRD
jgi:hypothetical protein